MMNRYQFRQLIRELFEPNGVVPFLFIAGSIALSIVGSAIYDLLTGWMGSEPLPLITIAIGAVLIVIAAIALLRWLIGRILMRITPAPISISPEHQMQPYPGLVLPFGLSDTGPERAIVEWHTRERKLRECWLLASPEVQAMAKYRDLKYLLVDNNVTIHELSIPDANQAQESYKQVKKALQNALLGTPALPVVADITGGTKAMTAGIVLACQELGLPMQYLPALRRPSGDAIVLVSGRQEPMMITFRTEPTA